MTFMKTAFLCTLTICLFRVCSAVGTDPASLAAPKDETEANHRHLNVIACRHPMSRADAREIGCP